MREIIKKSKFKIKNLPHGIVIDEKEIIDEKTSAKTIQSFFSKYWTKTSFRNTSIKNTHFEQYVKYEGPILERKNFAMKK